MPEQKVQALRKWVLWLLVGVCCLTVVACGGNTVNIYDKARVLDTAKVRDAASKVSKNVNVYTFNDFHGRQQDFYPTVVSKLSVNTNTVLMVIDTVHPSLYLLRGASVNLPKSDIAQVSNTFKTAYGNGSGGYTTATVSALNTLQARLNANHGSPLLPLLWLIPFIVIVGAFFYVYRRSRRRQLHYG